MNCAGVQHTCVHTNQTNWTLGSSVLGSGSLNVTGLSPVVPTANNANSQMVVGATGKVKGSSKLLQSEGSMNVWTTLHSDPSKISFKDKESKIIGIHPLGIMNVWATKPSVSPSQTDRGCLRKYLYNDPCSRLLFGGDLLWPLAKEEVCKPTRSMSKTFTQTTVHIPCGTKTRSCVCI